MRKFLWPFALLFWLVVWIRNRLFDAGILKEHEVDVPVLCVGNISVGGTGKTPWVQRLANYFHEQGHKVSVLSRGYSGDFDGNLKVTASMDPRQCGDEPLWLVRRSQATVYIGKNRLASAKMAMNEDDPGLLVLDDGFQHRRLKRQTNMVILDASMDRSLYQILPVGNLREGFSALKRAHVVVINKCNYASLENLQWLEQKCREVVPSERLFFADFRFSHWEPLVEGLIREAPQNPISMTCGVGNPRAFVKTLKALKIEPVKKFIFPDHYYWKPDDIERMTYNMKVEGSIDLMMTEKDAVKLSRYQKHFLEMGIQLWVCKMKVHVRDGESALLQALSSALDLKS